MVNCDDIPSSTSSNSLAECDFTAPEADQSNSLFHSKLTNKQPAQLVSNQSEVSIQQELLEAAAGKERTGKQKTNEKGKENSSKIMRLLPSSSSVQ